jgi:CheY-like chemotaxis protein
MSLCVPLVVVEDDAAIRRQLCSLLADEGYRLVQACDSHGALLVLQHTPVAMVALWDYCLPCLGGLQLLGALTLDLPALQRHGFILMTANASQLTAMQHHLLRQRGVALLHKPFTLETVLQTVARTVAWIEGHAQPPMPIQHPTGQQQAEPALAPSPLGLRALLRGKLARNPLRFGLPSRAAARREAVVQARARARARAQEWAWARAQEWAWARVQERVAGRERQGRRGGQMTRVLIVDDNPEVHSLLQLTLEDEEYQLAEANTGKAALELLLATAQPTVVLLNYRLPDMNGVTLLHQLLAAQAAEGAAQHPWRFLLCSALDPTVLEERCASLRGQVPIELVAKPFRLDPLLAAIQRAAMDLEAPGNLVQRAGNVRTRQRRHAVPAPVRQQQQRQQAS